MANITNQKGVLILDTVADNIVPAGTRVRIKSARFIGIAAGQATITDAGGSVAKLELSAVANGQDEAYFEKPLVLDGLKLIAITPTDRVYVYTV